MFLQECGLVAWEAAVDPLVSADVLLGNDLLNNLKRAAVEKKKCTNSERTSAAEKYNSDFCPLQCNLTV